MMVFSLLGIAVTSLLSSLIVLGAPTNSTYPLPLKLTGSAVYTHDPSIIYAEKLGYYYVFSTHGGVARSRALQGLVLCLPLETVKLGLFMATLGLGLLLDLTFLRVALSSQPYVHSTVLRLCLLYQNLRIGYFA